MGDCPHSFVVPRVDEYQDESRFLPSGSSLRIRRGSSTSPAIKRRLARRVHIKKSIRRSGSKTERRVRTLKRLIPNSDRSKDLEGLFRDTADYILHLRTRVTVMQMMIDVFTGSN